MSSCSFSHTVSWKRFSWAKRFSSCSALILYDCEETSFCSVLIWFTRAFSFDKIVFVSSLSFCIPLFAASTFRMNRDQSLETLVLQITWCSSVSASFSALRAFCASALNASIFDWILLWKQHSLSTLRTMQGVAIQRLCNHKSGWATARGARNLFFFVLCALSSLQLCFQFLSPLGGSCVFLTCDLQDLSVYIHARLGHLFGMHDWSFGLFLSHLCLRGCSFCASRDCIQEICSFLDADRSLLTSACVQLIRLFVRQSGIKSLKLVS